MQYLNVITIVPLVSFICYFFILLILIPSRKNTLARHYIVYIIAMLIWSLAALFMKIDIPPSPIFWNRIVVMGLVSIPILFYQFTIALTKNKNLNKKIILYIGYLGFVVLNIINFLGYIIKSGEMINDEFVYEIGNGAFLVIVYGLVYLSISFIDILVQVKTKKIPLVRVKLILFGLFLTLLGTFLNIFPNIGKYPIDIIANTLNAILIAYAIYRYKFLEIKLIVKKGLSYALFTITLSGVYIIAIFLVHQLISKLTGFSNTTITMSIAVILALFLQPVRNYVQNLIDRLFYRKRINHKNLLKNFSEGINNILDIDELTNFLLKTIKTGFQPKNIYLLLKEKTNQYKIYTPTKNNKNMTQFNCPDLIAEWFKQGHPLLTISEINQLAYFKCLSDSDQEQLTELDVEIIVPIKYHDELIGILILSEKNGGLAYSEEEMDVIYTLVNNAAIVIDNARMYEDARYQAITDGLTKLYNHRYFHEILGDIINNKLYSTFSIAMIDVDFFKFYNDLHGHSAGDRALVKIAELLQNNTRKKDIVVRYGGEEFAIIFPNTNRNEAYNTTNNIRKSVETNLNTNFRYNHFITVSAGIATYPLDGKTAELIVDCADKALYNAKENGRNKVITYSLNQTSNNPFMNYTQGDNIKNQINSAYLSSIYALAATIDAKDRYTYGHSENVSKLAVLLAKTAELDEKRIEVVKNAGLLHDLGKIGIPENILMKASRLSNEEYELMKKHVDLSISIIKHVPNLIEVIPAIMSHHERFDGDGYPRGLKGDNIPIEGRCLCIVDAFDAMTSDRPYRKALSLEEAIVELQRNSGTQFDPQLTSLFIRLLREGKLDDFLRSNSVA